MVDLEGTREEYLFLKRYEAEINTRIESIVDAFNDHVSGDNTVMERITELCLVHFKLGRMYEAEHSP